MDLDQDDASLVARIAGGSDPEGEADLCRRMAPRVRLYGLRHLRDPHAADDLVQQVLIITLQALRAGKLRDSGKLISFIFGTCRTLVLDQRRSTQRRDQLLEQFGSDMLSPAPAPAPQLDLRHLADCMQRLRERERAVVVMSFYEEQPGPDIARCLGITTANVRVLRHRAIHQLRDCMGVAQ